jgi:hypothetical protein
MPGLVPGIHVLPKSRWFKNVDGRDEPGHDGMKMNGQNYRSSGAVAG